MSYSEKISPFIFWCFPKFSSLNCFANPGFLFIKITSQAPRRINSLKIKDNTEFSVKQNHAWNHNEKLGAEGVYLSSFHSKTSTSLFHFNQLFSQICMGFVGGFFSPVWPYNYLRSFMATSII